MVTGTGTLAGMLLGPVAIPPPVCCCVGRGCWRVAPGTAGLGALIPTPPVGPEGAPPCPTPILPAGLGMEATPDTPPTIPVGPENEAALAFTVISAYRFAISAACRAPSKFDMGAFAPMLGTPPPNPAAPPPPPTPPGMVAAPALEELGKGMLIDWEYEGGSCVVTVTPMLGGALADWLMPSPNPLLRILVFDAAVEIPPMDGMGVALWREVATIVGPPPITPLDTKDEEPAIGNEPP